MTKPTAAPHPGVPRAPDESRADRGVRLAGLLDLARAGDRAALNEIVVELTPLLWHVARAQELSREAAEDVVQTTWMKLLQGLDQIRSPHALIGWLVTVTRREAWRLSAAGRGDALWDDQEAQELLDPDDLPEDQVLAHERRRILWAAVRRLEPKCQVLLRAVAYAPRLPIAILAKALGMPGGGIGPNRGRCLAKLRLLLADDETGYWR